VSWTVFSFSGEKYLATIDATDFLLSVSVQAGVVRDSAGNFNKPSNFFTVKVPPYREGNLSTFGGEKFDISRKSDSTFGGEKFDMWRGRVRHVEGKSSTFGGEKFDIWRGKVRHLEGESSTF
jgi:hypothetical protein